MIKSKVFTDLIVWQKAHKFVLQVYKSTKEYPQEEIYGLTSQFRRAAVSIPANISEGFKKRGKLDKARYLNIAEGSLEECRYYIILSNDLGYYKKDNLNNSLEEVSKLLSAYRSKIVNS